MLLSKKARFVDAIVRGDVALLKTLVRNSPGLLRETVTWKHEGEKMQSPPLHFAAYCDTPEVLAFMVQECKIPVDTRKSIGSSTALHVAFWADSMAAAEALLKMGADRDLKTEAGHAAYYFCKTEAAKDLLRPELERVIVRGSVAEVRAYLEKNPGVQDKYMQFSRGYTGFALNIAALHDRADIVKFLVKEMNVDIDRQKGHRGQWTALHHACDAGNAKAVAALLALGANPRLANDEGKMPMNLAKKNEIMALFLTYAEAALEAEKAEEERQSLKHRGEEEAGRWQRLSDVEVMCERKLPGQGGLHLTDIFNFKNRRWTSISKDPQSGHMAQSILFFDDVSDREELHRACAKLAELGGSPDPDSVDGRVIQKSKAAKSEAPGR